jgi:hypothetical protein
MRLIGKADCNPFFIESPELFDEPVIEFLRPFSGKEIDDLILAVNKFVAVAQRLSAV